MPPPTATPKSEFLKENILESISGRGLGWPQPWLEPGLAWSALYEFLLKFCTLSSDMWGGIPGHLSEALVCPLPQRRPKAKSCKENVLESISDRGLGWPQPWLGPGLAWAGLVCTV